MRFAGATLPFIFLAACKPLPDERHDMPGADAQAGLAIMKQVGCASCHSIPGVRWPQGRVGPSLDGVADQALIAGRAQNRPAILAAFVRNAPSVVPGTSMPAMPITPDESRDVAAYLYTLERR